MNLFLDKRTLKEVTLVGGAVVGLYVANMLRRPTQYPELDSYPYLKDSPLAPKIHLLSQLGEQAMFEEVCQLADNFARLLRDDASIGRGFFANRASASLYAKTQELVARASRSPDAHTAIRGMDFEKDELEQFGAVLDDMLRNMLME